MGLCKKHKIQIPNKVHEVITGVVDERYISRYYNPKPDGHQEDDEDVEDVVLGEKLNFQDWMRTGITHCWNQNTSNHKVMSIVQESLYNLHLQAGRPVEGVFQFMNPEAFQTNIAWPGDTPIFPEGATEAEPKQQPLSESEEERAEEGEGNTEEEEGDEDAEGDSSEDDIED